MDNQTDDSGGDTGSPVVAVPVVPVTSVTSRLKKTRPVVIFVVVAVVIIVIAVSIAVPLILARFKSDNTAPDGPPDDPNIPSGALTPGKAPSLTNGTLTFKLGADMDGLTKDKISIRLVPAAAPTTMQVFLLGHHSRSYVWMVPIAPLGDPVSKEFPDIMAEAAISYPSATQATVTYAAINSTTIKMSDIDLAGAITASPIVPNFPAPSLDMPDFFNSAFFATAQWDWGVPGSSRRTLVAASNGSNQNKGLISFSYDGRSELVQVNLDGQSNQIQSIITNEDTTVNFVCAIGDQSNNAVQYLVGTAVARGLQSAELQKLPTRSGNLWKIAMSEDGSYLLVVKSGSFELFLMNLQTNKYESKFVFAYVGMESGAVVDRGINVQICIGFDSRQYMIFTINTVKWTIVDEQSRSVFLEVAPKENHNIQNTAGPMALAWLEDTHTSLMVLSDTMGHAEIHTVQFQPLTT